MTIAEMIQDWQERGFIYDSDPEDFYPTERLMADDIDNLINIKLNKIIRKLNKIKDGGFIEDAIEIIKEYTAKKDIIDWSKWDKSKDKYYKPIKPKL